MVIMISRFIRISLIPKRCFFNSNENVLSTIFALSSGFGKCGVAVIRISGPDSKEVLMKMAGFKQLPNPRKAFLRKIKNPKDQNLLDQSLVIWFPGPKSFTGEDCCELQVHGGKAVVSAVLRTLSEMPNFRPAMPGEFTKRAFYSGKLDLTEVEGLADLIEAETEAQRKQALNQMNGALSKIYNSWRQSLTESVAKVEAFIDFSESENLEDDLIDETKLSIDELLKSIKKHIKDGRRGERLRDGVQTVILGAPNVGKSSLLNLLCRKEEAIVSPIAGTTRDIVSSTIDIGGYPLVVKDTAGLRTTRLAKPNESNESLNDSTSDPIEIEGISRALNAARAADLILLVLDPTHLDSDKSIDTSLREYCANLGITDFISLCDNNYLNKSVTSNMYEKQGAKRCLMILNKIDLLNDKGKITDVFDSTISCKNDDGVEQFLEKLTSNLESLCGSGDLLDATCNQIRHSHCLSEVVSSLESSLSTSELDIVAHHIRRALYSLGKITGHISTEQILDVIFQKFCIGK